MFDEREGNQQLISRLLELDDENKKLRKALREVAIRTVEISLHTKCDLCGNWWRGLLEQHAEGCLAHNK